jgi:thymidine kinase
VSSHTGVEIEATPVDGTAEIVRRILPDTEVVAIDEAQFLDEGIVEVATALAARGVRVIVAGTDTDFRGAPFGRMGELMAVAEDVTKLQAICVVCGDLACRNQRLIDGRPARFDSPTIMVGGSEAYEARCRRCHRVPRQDEDQTVMI